MSIGDHKPPVALIAGPTASGKSALALELAKRTNGVIVNADSAQIYRDLTVLSAAPSEQERALAEHRLYGVRDGADPCSAAGWAEMARAAIADVRATDRLPILVGGTGLYLRALLDGIAPVPPVDPGVRKHIRSAPVEENRARLEQKDPETAAHLGPADTARIARALEVVVSTGRSLAYWQRHKQSGIGDSVSLRPLILLPPRQWLYERCDRRFEMMIADGAVDEVRSLLERRLDPSLPVMRAIGVRELAAMLSGKVTRDQAIERGRQATRNYAKRQYTWFAHQPPAEWARFTSALDGDAFGQALALLEPSA